jgi:hypothetical protein
MSTTPPAGPQRPLEHHVCPNRVTLADLSAPLLAARFSGGCGAGPGCYGRSTAAPTRSPTVTPARHGDSVASGVRGTRTWARRHGDVISLRRGRAGHRPLRTAGCGPGAWPGSCERGCAGLMPSGSTRRALHVAGPRSRRRLSPSFSGVILGMSALQRPQSECVVRLTVAEDERPIAHGTRPTVI